MKKTAQRGAGNGRVKAANGGAGAERRRRLTEWMRTQPGPVHGDDLARRFRVSRQCLVQDVAVLRAAGVEILSRRRRAVSPGRRWGSSGYAGLPATRSRR